MKKSTKRVLIVSIVIAILAVIAAVAVLFGNSILALFKQLTAPQSAVPADTAPVQAEPYDYEYILTPTIEREPNLSAKQLETVKHLIERELLELRIADFKVTVYNQTDRIRVQLRKTEQDVDFQQVLEDCTVVESKLEFYRDTTEQDGSVPPEQTEENSPVLTTEQLVSVLPGVNEVTGEYYVLLTFDEDGTLAFEEATTELAALNQELTAPIHTVSVWLNGTCLINPIVSTAIVNGEVQISGSFASYEEAEQFAAEINLALLSYEITAIN